MIHEELTNARQQTTDTWFDAGIQYMKSVTDSAWYRSEKMSPGSSRTDPYYHPLPPGGFSDVDLIKAENYAGIASYDKRNCLVFVPGGADKLNLKIADLPIHYHERIYGTTNIQRWRHGWLLFKMMWFAARKLKFI